MPGTGGFFNAILKVLLDDAEKVFSGGVLGRAVEQMAKGPKADAGVSRAATAIVAGPPARAGANIWQPTPAAASANGPVPILKQILAVLESVARKIGILPRVHGAPGPGIGQQVSQIGQRLFTPRHIVTQNTGGSARYHFQQIAHQLAGKPFFKQFVPPPKAATAVAGLGQTLLALGRLAGIAGLVTGVFGLAAAALKNFVAGVLDSNRELYRYNAQLAGSFAQLDIGRMQLDIQQARAVAPGAKELNEAILGLQQEFQPVRQVLANIANKIATVATNSARGVLWLVKSNASIAAINAALPGVGDLIKKILDGEEKRNKEIGGALTDDLKALRNPGGAFMAGGRIVPPKQPVFLPPLIRPVPLVRQNPGGR